jgi:signal transduction histidine kinase
MHYRTPFDDGTRGAGFAVRCDIAGVVLQILVQEGEPALSMRAGRSLLDAVDLDSRLKMENFLFEARRGQPAVGWEMGLTCSVHVRSMVFAGVSAGGVLVVAAAATAIRLAGILDQLRTEGSFPETGSIRLFSEAAALVRLRAEDDGGLFDELSRLNNDLSNLQRELAKSNRALGRQKEWLWDILSSLEEAVVATGTDGMVTFMNRAAVLLTGRDLAGDSPVALKDLLLFTEAPFAERAAVSLESVWAEGRTVPVRGYLPRNPPREAVPISGVANPLLDQSGTRIGALVLLRDMTEALRIQQVLVDTERLGVAAEMAAGIAHTVNNVLFIISGNAEALQPHIPPERIRPLENIRAGVQRIADLTTRLLAFTNGGAEHASTVDLNAVVRAAVAQQGLKPAEVLIRLDLADEPVMVLGSADKLSAAVNIILSNALEAIHGPGLIAVSTGRESGRGADSADHAVLRITDDGEGMTPDVQRRLFTPFASTKFLGRGLGLATARATLAAHGGHVVITSAPGTGTTVTILLPSHPGPDAGKSARPRRQNGHW